MAEHDNYDTQVEQGADLEQLMHLSISEVAKLPAEQKKMVFDEVARQADKLDIPDGLAAELKELAGIPQQAAEALQQLFNRFYEMQQAMQRKFEEMRASYDYSSMAEAMRQFSAVSPILQPYVDKLYAEDREKWGRATIAGMYAAAAAAARADGQEVPQLWFEKDGEQLAMDLNVLMASDEEANKKESAPATPAKLIESLATVQAITAAAHVMPNNPLINEMERKKAINAGPFDLIVANEQGRRKEISNYCIISYEPEAGIKLEVSKLTEYERQISDAVISLWAEAQRRGIPAVMTDDQIYQSMPGGGERPSPAQRGAIARTMGKFRRLMVYMDATQELQKRGLIDKDETYIFNNHYFNFGQGTRKAINSRKSVNTYLIESKPIMYEYSEMTGQLLTVQAKYLNIRKIKGGKISTEIVAMTPGRQAMTGYMLRRIAVIRHDEEAAKDALRQYEKRRRKETELEARPLASFRRQSRTILFDTLFDETGTATEDRKQTGLNRAFCFDVLEYWRITGLIKGYAEQHKGRKITGFSVTI